MYKSYPPATEPAIKLFFSSDISG